MSKSISRKSNRRQGPGSSKEKEPLSDSGRPGSSKQKEPLSLCFYTLDRTVGVVLREKLDPPNALEGTVANAPLPVDFPETQTGEMFEVSVIMHGYSLEYLNSVLVDENGMIMTDNIYVNTNLAVKKTNKAQEKRILSQAMMNIDGQISALPDLSAQYQKNGEQNTGGTESQPSMQTAETGMTADSNNKEEQQVVPLNAHQCPVADVIKAASPENIEFLEKLIKAMKEHRHEGIEVTHIRPPLTNQGTTKIPAVIVIEHENETPPSTEQGRQPPTGHATNATGQPTNPPQEMKLQDILMMLPCFQPAEEKVRLVENMNVYVHKWDYASIPAVTPRMPEHKGLKIAPEGGLFPRGMVKYLVDLLIPLEIQKGMKDSTDLPDILRKAILTYINYRLLPAFKLNEAKLHEFVYDICRKKK